MASYPISNHHKSSSTSKPRSEHKRQQAEYSKRDSESSNRDTLRYYSSPLADGRLDESSRDSSRSPTLIRRASGVSTSSSDYSDSQVDNVSTVEPRARRRSMAPSNGSSDRRRLAIVQMDPLDDPPPGKSVGGHSQSRSTRSRGPVPASLDGLALVAPPDAAPKSYTHLTPPITASAASEALRDAARDGREHTESNPKVSNGDTTPATGTLTKPHAHVKGEGLTQPSEQPSWHSASPSLSVIPGVFEQAHGLLSPVSNTPSAPQSLVVTPEIGEEKEISARVAAPVVISLSSAGPFRRKDSSKPWDLPTAPASAQLSQGKDYLSYQPGVHATAGPLPPPPRAVFNIDITSPAPPRPPRLNSPHVTRSRNDIEAVKQALQLPSSVKAKLASRSPSPNSTSCEGSPETDLTAAHGDSGKTAESTSDTELHHVNLGHKREGAFPPSASTSTASDSEAAASPLISKKSNGKFIDSVHGVTSASSTNTTVTHSTSSSDVPPITVVNPMTPIEEQKESLGTNETNDVLSTPSARRRTSDEVSSENGSPSRSPTSVGQIPSPPPKSFRNSLTTNLKRFSSLSSKSRRSSNTLYSSRTPSPSIHAMAQPPPFRPKIVSHYPPAMFYAEITTRKTSLERCALYAQKINELAMYDSGLGEWTIETKARGSLSSHVFTPQPRHTSRASMLSEATFPRRPDASTATDLSVKTHDITHSTPPTLPYPSLMNQHIQPSSRTSSLASGTPPSSVRSLAPSTPTSKSGGGFFSSLGRKASMSSTNKKEKLGSSTTATNNTSPARLVKSPPANAALRTMNITHIPSVPGGPRAAPNRRAMRSKTILTTTSPFASNAASPERNEELMRRPSLADLNTDVVLDISADPEFVRQVDKLADLLPNADRGVLAGYLRRAGQDILAIGQYLEDEKNGVIKAP